MREGSRVIVQVRTSVVRPVPWGKATRDVSWREVVRRAGARVRPLSALPLLAEPVEALGFTPETAEAAALSHFREARVMLNTMERARAPSSLLQVFTEHVEAMRVQTAWALGSAEGGSLPSLMLVDGIHRWYIAQQNETEVIFVSIPVECHDKYKTNSASAEEMWTQQLGDAGMCASAAVETAKTGAHMNYASHMTTQMTTGDRVFLLQSWYLASLDACPNSDTRAALKKYLSVVCIHDLLCYSVAVRSTEFRGHSKRSSARQIRDTKNFETAVDNGRLRAGELATPEKVLLLGRKLSLPPPFVLLIAPQRNTRRETVYAESLSLVSCAIETSSTPMARKLVGAILQTVDDEDVVFARDDDPSTLQPISTMALRTEHLSLNNVRVLELAIRVCRKCVSVPAALQAQPGLPLCQLEATLALHHSMRSLALCDPSYDMSLAKGKVPRTRVTWRNIRKLGQRKIFPGILKSLLRSWEEGLPLDEIAANIAALRLVAFSSHHVLGKKCGRDLDRSHVSLLVRTGVSKVPVHTRNDTAHSIRCFLLHVPSSGTTTSCAGRIAEPTQPCICDWYTERSIGGAQILSEVLFQCPYAPETLYTSMKRQGEADTHNPASTRKPVDGEDEEEGSRSSEDWETSYERLKTVQEAEVERQWKSVSQFMGLLNALVEVCRAQIDEPVHLPCAKLIVLTQRCDMFLTYVEKLLLCLRRLAEEAGILHDDLTTHWFRKSHETLIGGEDAWNGTGDSPGLKTVYITQEIEDPVSECGCCCEDTPLSSQANGRDVIRKWRMRLCRCDKIKAARKKKAAKSRQNSLRPQRPIRNNRCNDGGGVGGDAQYGKGSAEKTPSQALSDLRKGAPLSQREALGHDSHGNGTGEKALKENGTTARTEGATASKHANSPPLSDRETRGRDKDSNKTQGKANCKTGDEGKTRGRDKDSNKTQGKANCKTGDEGKTRGDAASYRRAGASLSQLKKRVRESNDNRGKIKTGDPGKTASGAALNPGKSTLLPQRVVGDAAGDPPQEENERRSQRKRQKSNQDVSIRGADARTMSMSATVRTVRAQTGRETDDNYFDDTPGPVPERIRKAVGSTIGARRQALPRLVQQTSNTPYFVDVSTAQEIQTWASAALKKQFGDRGCGLAYLSMTDVGYFCLPRIFDSGQAREDVVTVNNIAVESLELPKCTEGPKHIYDATKAAVPIPNIGPNGHGRSQAGKEFWQVLEKCGNPKDEEAAHAFHRLITRASSVVSKVMDFHPGSKNSTQECPMTGGRVLITSPPNRNLPRGGLSQKGHIDFRRLAKFAGSRSVDVGLQPDENHSTPLFLICTGDQGAALRVYPGSPRWAFSKDCVFDVASTVAKMKLEWIPPYSLFAMRGDCVHAGAAFQETKWLHICHGVESIGCPDFQRGFARFHMYVMTGDTGVTNHIHFVRNSDDFGGRHEEDLFLPETNGMSTEGFTQEGNFVIKKN